MFGQPKMEIIVDKKGQMNIEVKDVADGTCLKMTQDIEEAVGKVTKRTLKSEAHKTGEVAEVLKVQN